MYFILSRTTEMLHKTNSTNPFFSFPDTLMFYQYSTLDLSKKELKGKGTIGYVIHHFQPK